LKVIHSKEFVEPKYVGFWTETVKAEQKSFCPTFSFLKLLILQTRFRLTSAEFSERKLKFMFVIWTCLKVIQMSENTKHSPTRLFHMTWLTSGAMSSHQVMRKIRTAFALNVKLAVIIEGCSFQRNSNKIMSKIRGSWD